MAEFVYGNDALLDGKSDAGPLTVPANQGVTATEWNTDQRHKDELRTAIKSGTYHGISQSSEAVSAANKAKLRLNTSNKLQASVNAGVYTSIVQPWIHVSDYGAVGDGSTDDSTAIQAALAASATLGRPLMFEAKTYKISTELTVFTQRHLIGQSYSNGVTTKLIAGTAGQRSILRIGADTGAEGGANTECHIENIVFDADRKSTYGIYALGWSGSIVRNCRFNNALRDGIYLKGIKSDGSTVCISDHNSIYNCQFSSNGSFYGSSVFSDPNEATADLRTKWYSQSQPYTTSTATCDTTSGSSNITIVGATFQTWNIRAGDMIRIGTGADRQQYTVRSVTSETVLVINGTAALTKSAQSWVLCCGAGWFESGHPDNNINKFYSCQWTANVGGCCVLAGIYGPHISGSFMQYSPLWAITVGNGATGVVINSLFTHNYFESFGRRPFYFVSSRGAYVIAPLLTITEAYDIIAANSSGAMFCEDNVYCLDFTVDQQTDNSGLSTMRNWLPAKASSAMRMFGHTRHFSKQYNQGTNWTPTGGGAAAIDPEQDVVPLASTGAITVAAVPHFTVENEREIAVYNRGTFNIILQDESSLAGSKLQLAGSVNVTLTPRSSITLFCADGYWTEKSRSIR